MDIQKIQQFGSLAVIGNGSSCHTVLLKFLFTNPKHLPVGLQEQTDQVPKRSELRNVVRTIAIERFGQVNVRPDNTTMDVRHIKAAHESGYGHLSSVGRVREGRVDTGNHFIDNVQDVQVACLVRGLSNIGYFLSQCHWYFQRGEGKSSDKFVVVVGFTDRHDNENELVELPVKCTEQRRVLAKTCWQWCHGWANPNGVITLNFGGRKPDGKPRHAIVVRDRKLGAAYITESVTEEKE